MRVNLVKSLQMLADMPGTSKEDQELIRAAATEIDRLRSTLAYIATIDNGQSAQIAQEALNNG